jgi:hypothetical protein
MRTALAVISFALAAALPLAASHAQPYQGPSITIPLPGVSPGPGGGDDRERREHCAALENREHELHERMQRVGYSEDRDHLDHQLRETHEQMRDQCHR